jgi:hypothetical protein
MTEISKLYMPSTTVLRTAPSPQRERYASILRLAHERAGIAKLDRAAVLAGRGI